jgi:hypothetical protein
MAAMTTLAKNFKAIGKILPVRFESASKASFLTSTREDYKKLSFPSCLPQSAWPSSPRCCPSR